MYGFQCEGKAYNDKSDIWAMGCILYEMACLQKTFEGSNLPALVNKIMKVMTIQMFPYSLVFYCKIEKTHVTLKYSDLIVIYVFVASAFKCPDKNTYPLVKR